MKASELIKELQKAIEKHGDFEVAIDNGHFYYNGIAGVSEILLGLKNRRWIVLLEKDIT